MASTATPPRRQSCDRCHGQKLRCTRTGNNDRATCIRCLRQGTECVYSSSLPKGRPSMYRSVDTLSGDSSVSNISPAAIRRRPRQNPQSAATSPGINLNPSATSAGTSHLDTTFAAFTGATSIPTSCGTDTRYIADTNTAKPHGPNSTLDSTIDRESVFPALMDKSTAMWSHVSQLNSHEPEGYDKDMDWSTNMLDLIGHQMDASLAFLKIPPGILPLNNDEASRLEGEFLVITDNENGTVPVRNSPDAGISQLSQLSNRLSVLHRWSCALGGCVESPFPRSTPAQASQSPLINEPAFKSVVSWLIHASADMKPLSYKEYKPNSVEPSSRDDTLQHIFSASHQFMETLRRLQSGYACRIQMCHSHLNEGTSCNPQTDLPSPPASAQGMPLATPHPCDPYSSVAERHLVIACHTLLLEIYVSVFGSLQRDVDHRLDSDPVDQDAAVETASLGDMPLVLVVQLCSYILDRQHRAVSSYLSPKPGPGQPGQIDVSGSPKFTAIQGVNTGPDSEVQRRLERLRQSLRI
ncbi:hypothetical protein BDW66DRAFT_133510 [Aspergillus desertorum]